MSIVRVSSRLATRANCSVSTTNDAACERISRAYDRILAVKSSAYESLTNDNDVSDDQLDFFTITINFIGLFYGNDFYWYTGSNISNGF